MSTLFLQHGLACRPKLVAGPPLGKPVRVGHAIAHCQEDFEIFSGAAQIPRRLHNVARLVVVVLVVGAQNLLAKFERLTEILDALDWIESWHPLLGEAEVIRAVVETFFRFRIAPDNTALFTGGVPRVVVEF